MEDRDTEREVGMKGIKLGFLFTLILSLVLAVGISAQSSSKGSPSPSASPSPTSNVKTVEEAFLEESLTAMVINEQARSEDFEMKQVALKMIAELLKNGQGGADVEAALTFLALEGTNSVAREGGVGRVINNYPTIRKDACTYLGLVGTESAKNTLLIVLHSDNEPMVLGSAMEALGKIGLNKNNEVSTAIAEVIIHYNNLRIYDSSLALSALYGFEGLMEKATLRDPKANQAILIIQSGNYVKPVQQKAAQVFQKMYTSSGSSSSSSK
jgi:hypothetical protein